MARRADLRSATFTSHPVPFASGLLVAVALVLSFSLLDVLPAPNRPLLALGVGAPEIRGLVPSEPSQPAKRDAP